MGQGTGEKGPTRGKGEGNVRKACREKGRYGGDGRPVMWWEREGHEGESVGRAEGNSE